jgi:hypothetical protein
MNSDLRCGRKGVGSSSARIEAWDWVSASRENEWDSGTSSIRFEVYEALGVRCREFLVGGGDCQRGVVDVEEDVVYGLDF